eukprot:327458-Prorocentrum_lima.AAC.1
MSVFMHKACGSRQDSSSTEVKHGYLRGQLGPTCPGDKEDLQRRSHRNEVPPATSRLSLDYAYVATHTAGTPGGP